MLEPICIRLSSAQSISLSQRDVTWRIASGEDAVYGPTEMIQCKRCAGPTLRMAGF
jgi:hypothetical protein